MAYQQNSLHIVHETQRQMLELASLISACACFWIPSFCVTFGLMVNSCLAVWSGRVVSCLPRESEASRRPVTLDSPAVENGSLKLLRSCF